MGRCALQGREGGEEARPVETMRGWQDLGVVDTIYEEEQEEDEEEEEGENGSKSNSLFLTNSPTSTPTPSHSLSSPLPSASLQSLVEAWSRATGSNPNVVVQVDDQCFHLHSDALASRSGYIRRRLMEFPDVAVTAPSNITAEAISAAARFCYGAEVALTASNLAAIWLAAEWLEMAADGGGGGGGLVGRTEEYFEKEVAGDNENAAHVLRACVGLLPEAAGLAGRCVAALTAAAEESGGEEVWVDDVASLGGEEFRVVAEAMRGRAGCDHDLLYRVVDHYLQKQGGKLTEEEKSRICYTVDCRKLSQQKLLHLVHNPRLPLRFVVQAMLLDHLHTRTRLAFRRAQPKPPPLRRNATDASPMTLGAILQRDAALRQAAHLRAAMEATSFRIQSLERDVEAMRRRLRWSEEKRAELESARSESFRIVRRQEEDCGLLVAPTEKSCSGASGSGTSLGKKLMRGLKSMFRTSAAKPGVESEGSAGDGDCDGEVVAAEHVRPQHRRNRSFT